MRGRDFALAAVKAWLVIIALDVACCAALVALVFGFAWLANHDVIAMMGWR